MKKNNLDSPRLLLLTSQIAIIFFSLNNNSCGMKDEPLLPIIISDSTINEIKDSSLVEVINKSSSSCMQVYVENLSSSSEFEIQNNYSSSNYELESSSSSNHTVKSSSSIQFIEGMFVDDRDGNTYKTIINVKTKHEFFAQNLNFGEYNNTATSSKTLKYCYNNDTLNCTKYGGLYTWSMALNIPETCNIKSSKISLECEIIHDKEIASYVKGICPDNWHILDTNDWNEISNNKELSDLSLRTNDAEWISGGTDEIGFSMLPGGFRDLSSGYKELHVTALYWIPNEVNILDGLAILSEEGVTKYVTRNLAKSQAFSIRCAKNGT